MYGRYLEEVDCRHFSSIGEITEALRIRAAQTPPGQWVLGHTYDDTLLKEQRHLTRQDLDRVSDRHPVVLRHISVHSMVVNTEALRLAGIGPKTPDPGGGRIGRDARGEPDGLMWEWAQNLGVLSRRARLDVRSLYSLCADRASRLKRQALPTVLINDGHDLQPRPSSVVSITKL